MSVILLIPKTKIIASMIEAIILFILKKFVNLVQLDSKIYHDFDKKNELKQVCFATVGRIIRYL